MAHAWQILRDGGLPLDLPSSGVAPGAGELAAALRSAIGQGPSGRDAEALAAFVFAWHQHWPASFADALGVDGAAVLAWAAEHAIDDNRYLKLRRIALERLANVL